MLCVFHTKGGKCTGKALSPVSIAGKENAVAGINGKRQAWFACAMLQRGIKRHVNIFNHAHKFVEAYNPFGEKDYSPFAAFDFYGLLKQWRFQNR
jgi:hypothetical protein